MAHNGLALSARSDAGATGAGGTTTCTDAAGFVEGATCVLSARSASSEPLETADIDTDSPPCTDSTRSVVPIASFRIISRPAIDPTPPAEPAISPHRTKWSGLERRVDR